MSCSWHVRCVDCGVTHYLSNSNHRDEEVSKICRNAPAIAALDDLISGGDYVSLIAGDGSIRADWFRDHLGHRLVPIDEYGRLLAQCRKSVDCACCGTSRMCRLDLDHAGACSAEAARR